MCLSSCRIEPTTRMLTLYLNIDIDNCADDHGRNRGIITAADVQLIV